jgi:hypothetical protein
MAAMRTARLPLSSSWKGQKPDTRGSKTSNGYTEITLDCEWSHRDSTAGSNGVERPFRVGLRLSSPDC